MVVNQSETNTYTITAVELADAINALLAAHPGAQIADPTTISSVVFLAATKEIKVTAGANGSFTAP